MPAEDPYQQLLRIANHEAGHACGHYRYGQAIAEVDIDRPSHGSLGHVVPAEPEPLMLPPGLEGADTLAWIDGALFRGNLETAVIARLGGMFGHDDWRGDACAGDRAIVARACPRTFELDTWEALVEIHARKLFDDPRYVAAHKALAGALLQRRHEAMSGDRAFEVIEQALAEYDREHAGSQESR